MNEKIFSEILTKKLRELELICAPLKSDPTPGQMDIELALDKTRELYQWMAEHLKEKADPLPEVQLTKKEIPQKEIKKTEEPVKETKKAIPYIDVTKGSSSLSQPAKQNITEMEPEETVEINTEENNGFKTPPEPEPPMREPKKEGKATIGERFQNSETSFVNENLGKNKENKDITSKLQSKPITDLRASIGINEKFLFIKELFKGNSDYYSKSIDFLNQAGSIDNAMQYIHENFQWDKESETTTKFLELVNRKFRK